MRYLGYCRAICAVLLSIAILMLSVSPVYAAIPGNTIIFGIKAYDISLLNETWLASTIVGEYVANGNRFYFKNLVGRIVDQNALLVDPLSLPSVNYQDADGYLAQYGPADGTGTASFSLWFDHDVTDTDLSRIGNTGATVTKVFEGLKKCVRVSAELGAVGLLRSLPGVVSVGQNRLIFGSPY